MRLAILILVIALTIYLFSIRHQIDHLRAYGYPGIFLFSLLSNATLIIPMPAVALTSVMGAIFDPFWVAVASASGSAIGEMTGYLAGISGSGIVENVKWYKRMEDWIKSPFGGLVILIMAFIPNPLFDMAGMAAGALRMSPIKFFLWCLAGKMLKMLAFAYGGAWLLG